MTERLGDDYEMDLEPPRADDAVLVLPPEAPRILEAPEVAFPYSEQQQLGEDGIRLPFHLSLTDNRVLPRVRKINAAYEGAVTAVADYLLERSQEAYPDTTRYRDTVLTSGYHVHNTDELDINLADKLMHEPTRHYDTGHLRNFRVQTVSPEVARDLCDETWDLSVSKGTRNESLPEFTAFLLASADAHVGRHTLGVGYLAQIALAGSVATEADKGRITSHGLFQGRVLPRDRAFLLTKRATENSLPLSTGVSRGRGSGKRRYRL